LPTRYASWPPTAAPTFTAPSLTSPAARPEPEPFWGQKHHFFLENPPCIV